MIVAVHYEAGGVYELRLHDDGAKCDFWARDVNSGEEQLVEDIGWHKCGAVPNGHLTLNPLMMTTRTYNILWALTEKLHAAIFDARAN